MSQTIWVPGLGNTVTFDGAPIPPGGYMVSPPPQTVVSGVIYNPAVLNSSGARPGNAVVDYYYDANGTIQYPKNAKRLAEKQNNTVWANDPSVRSIEEKSWDIYVDTGRWDTPEQISYHQQADAMRAALNPMFKGTGTSGPITQGDENKISLPAIAADPTLGKFATYGALGLGAILLMSFLKG